MADQCKALVVNCMDYRLVQPVKDFAFSLGLNGSYDQVAIAGGVKNLVMAEDTYDREFLVRQIELAKNLHGIEQVILINHTDCGAYGGREAFKSEEEEREKHLEDLRGAKKLILEKWLGLEVILFLARIDKEGRIDFEKVS